MKRLATLLVLVIGLAGSQALAGKVGKDCTYKGKKLWGKVKFVDSFPDLKVQIVSSFPDLKVKMVDAFPDKCGKWKVVDSFPDIKIKIVNSFPDIKIKYVDAFYKYESCQNFLWIVGKGENRSTCA